MASSILLGKRLRRQIRRKAWPILRDEGFAAFGSLRAYRVRDGVLEVVEFATVKPEWNSPRWLGGTAYSNGATFTLLVGTHFLDSEVWARLRCHECHLCTRLAHESVDSVADGRTFWPGAKGERLGEIVEEAVRVLKGRGLHVLSTHSKDPCDVATFEEAGLSHAEAEEMMRICREGRVGRSGALDGFHRRVHLADEMLVA